MASKKEEKIDAVEEVIAPKSDRKARWEKHLEAYKAKNPVKFAIKEKAGEFKEIPASFV